MRLSCKYSGLREALNSPPLPTPRPSESAGADRLSDDDLDTILVIARNQQSGRITEREIKLLVAAYRNSGLAGARAGQ